MGFAEQFIQGYSVGSEHRARRERQALAQQEFEERKKERDQQLTMAEKMFKLHQAGVQNEFAKQVLAARAATPQPVTELPAGQAGPPAPTPEPPVEFVNPVSGERSTVASPHLEEVQAEKQREFESQKRLVDLLDKVTFTHDIPEIGVKAGEQYDPKEVSARTAVFGAKERRAAAETAAQARTNQLLTSRVTNLTPLTDEYGNFTGQLMDKMGQLHENPKLAGLRGKPLTGQVASTVHQASIISDQADLLLDRMEAIKDKLGPAMGRITKIQQLIGNPDPDINRFATDLASFVALQPKLHGFRGASALEHFDKIVGGIKMTPEALAASIQGIKDLGDIIESSAKPQTGKAKTPDAEADSYLKSIGG